MAQQTINLGNTDQGNGDPIRTAFNKVNQNFTELYTALGLGDTSLNLGSFEFTNNVMTTTDSSAVVIDQNVTITNELTMQGDIIPNVPGEHNLGSAVKPWGSLYVSGNTIYINGNALGLDSEGELIWNGSRIAHEDGEFLTLDNLSNVNTSSPNAGDTIAWAGSQWVNVPLPTLTSQLTNDSGFLTSAVLNNGLDADIKGSVFADDSTIMVNAIDNTLHSVSVNTLQLKFNISGDNIVNVIDGGYITIGNGQGTNWAYFDQDLTLFPGIVQVNGAVETETIRSEGNINIDINLSDSTLRRWRFGEDGDLTLPIGSIKHDTTGGFVTLEGPLYSQMVEAPGGGIATISNGIKLLTHRPGDNLDHAFNFSWDGALYMPYDVANSQVGAIEWRRGSVYSLLRGTNGGPTYVDGRQIPPGLQIYNYNSSSGFSIRTQGDPVGANWFIFDTDGSLSLPGDIKSEGDINIDINLSDSTLRRWQFGEDGTFNLAGGIKARTDTSTAFEIANGPEDGAILGFKVIDEASENPICSISLTNPNVTITTGGGTKTWTFDNTGTLSFPGGAGSFINYDSNILFIHPGTNKAIVLGDFGGNYWNFNSNNGSILFPDLTTQTTAFTGTADIARNIESENGVSIKVNLTDSTQRIWQFGEDGNLTFPDGTNQSTAFTGNAATIDIMNTNGIDTNYSITFVENRSATQDLRADVDLTFNSATNLLSTGNISATGTITTGVLKIDDGAHEKFQAKADATGTVTHDCASGHVFYHTSPDANWTANFTNLNLDSGYATALTLVIVQGGTGYYPSAVQIGGVGQTLNWQANTSPTPNPNRTDVVTFSIINNSGTYTVLGQLTGF